jgi:sodium/proline symporter
LDALSANANILIAFLAYFSVLLAIGVWSHKKMTSSDEFMLGGRSLNFWVIALSAHASDMSSWLFMAFPAAIMIRGIPEGWMALGLFGGMYLTWQFVAVKLRESTEKLDSYTLPTFFERRFKDDSGVIRIITALMAVVFLTFYISAGLIAMGILLESVFGIDYYFGLTVAMFVVIAYTFLGGFITVAWTDMFQAVFLLLMVIFVPVVAYFTLPDGWNSILVAAQDQDISLHLLEDTSWTNILSILFLVFGWGLGYFGQPHIVTKFMGIRNSKELVKSKYVGMAWMFIALSAAAFVGLVGIAFFNGQLQQSELVFVQMVRDLFHPIVGGFILCGLIAASMSTMDSQILVSASVLGEDFYRHFFKKPVSGKKMLKTTRFFVALVALGSLAIAFKRNSTLLDAVQYAWSGLGSSFGPLMLMSLYYKKATRAGAIAGLLVGGLLSGLWHFINPYLTDIIVPSMIPGFFGGLLAIYVVSLMTQE